MTLFVKNVKNVSYSFEILTSSGTSFTDLKLLSSDRFYFRFIDFKSNQEQYPIMYVKLITLSFEIKPIQYQYLLNDINALSFK